MARSKCRIGKKDDLISVCDLGSHSMCGFFQKDKDQEIEKGSLELGWSPGSGLLQLVEERDISLMYGDNYGYRSGLNSSMVEHLRNKVKYLINLCQIEKPSCVLDIGSNDGTLLSFYDNSIERIGIDPTIKKYFQYYQKDIVRVAEFFDNESFAKSTSHNKADIITSVSMFYDLPDPNQFVSDIASILSENGIWHLEQSYMPSMLRTNSYDTVCHEHLEYYSLKVIKDLVESHNLKIIDVLFNSINGGSFSVTVAHESSKYACNNKIINWMLSQERRMGLDTPVPYRLFEERAYRHRTDLKELISAIKHSGNKIAGYGASTKGNVILQFCNLNSNDLFAIAEINNDKFGRFTPGSKIPILSEEEVKNEKPEFMLVLPWHFREGIIRREKEYLNNGGKLIFPLPEIEIVG